LIAAEQGLASTFDRVARLYDQIRPGYPEALIDDAIALSGISLAGRILEIGCGSGQATLPFARRGYTLLALEPGRNLAALAATHCRPYPQVQIEPTSFEAWTLQPQRFDLVLSASAFDWIPPETGFPKAAAALKEGGALALLWNDHCGADTPFFRAVKRVHRTRAPQLAGSADPRSLENRLADQVQQFERSGLFGPVIVRRYPWSTVYSAREYVKLLSTYSAVQALPPATRRYLLQGIRDLVDRFGGQVDTQYLSVLFIAGIASGPTSGSELACRSRQ
jgi:SAM-dependent methyltransferase